MRIKNIFSLSLILLFILFDMEFCLAKNRCKDVIAVSDSTITYKDRGNRCEGFYQSMVSVGSLDLVGLMVGGELAYDLEKDENISISSPLVRKLEVHVQAIGIPMKTYYRLDGWLQSGVSLDWPLAIIKKKHLSDRDIGLFGQLVATPEIYVPLAVVGGSSGSSQITLTLRPVEDVGAIHWRLGTLNGLECGDMSNAKWQLHKPTSGEQFFSGEPISVNLQEQRTDFCIEFAARPEDCGIWLKRLVKVRIED